MVTWATFLGGGFLLSLASFVIATAALETGSPYAQLGSSRAKTFSAITEPVVLFVVFTVALLTGTDLPYALVLLLVGGAASLEASQRRACPRHTVGHAGWNELDKSRYVTDRTLTSRKHSTVVVFPAPLAPARPSLLANT